VSRRRLHLWRQTPVFHVRLGGCRACGDMADMVLRGSLEQCPPVVECGSPRHAALMIVTGLWSEEIAGTALAVTGQGPSSRKLILAGDCALGRGVFARRIKHLGSVPEGLEADIEVAGCPCSIEALCEGMRDVAD
jgi:Ni,Fe-hydrogenase III small subunit